MSKCPFRLAVAMVVVCAVPLAAQGTPRACPTQGFFDFQVDRPAAFVPDSLVSPRPVEPTDTRPSNVVQFHVDTAGIPDTTSFRVLWVADASLVADARAVLSKWRFTPASVGSCKVMQLIQTAIAR